MGKALGPCSCSVRLGHLNVEFDQRLYYSIDSNLESCFHFCLHRSHQNEVLEHSCCARDGHHAGSLQSEFRAGTGPGRSTCRSARTRRASSGSGRTRTRRARRTRARSVTDQSDENVTPAAVVGRGVLCCLAHRLPPRPDILPSDRALVGAILRRRPSFGARTDFPCSLPEHPAL